MIAVGQKLPNATLYEFLNEASEGCAIGPNAFEVDKLTAGKKIVIFGLPGAFTPTCSAQHVPGYLEQFDAIKAKGVDEIWCVSVNDPFVMGAWGRDLKVAKLGLEFDLTKRGLGVRSQRYAMVVDNGMVKHLVVEEPGKFDFSDAKSILQQL